MMETHLELDTFAISHPVCHADSGGAMAIAWYGGAASEEVLNPGPLTLFQPLLKRLDVASIIDRHLPPDPQLEFSHGQILSLLLAARLAEPTALVNVADWAEKSGADLLWNIPIDKLNDDRLGRALDAFFEERHSILASVTDNVLRWAEMPLDRLHFDTTHLIFYGAYANSSARPPHPAETLTGDGQLAPAHITHSYLSKHKMVQVGLTAAIDDLGALPVACHVLDGNRNGHTAIKEQFDLLNENVPLPDQVLFISDRGTYSVEHAARLHRHGHRVLCAVPWQDYRPLYDAHEVTLTWQHASFLSQEQQRRRDTASSLPHEHYELAVLRHTLIDPTSGAEIPSRIIFTYSTADAAECRHRRERNIATIKAGLQALVAKLERGHPATTTASIQRQIAQLLGKRDAARYFHWELIPLTAQEQTALPTPRRGFLRPTHRLTFAFDATAAQTDSRYDGLAALVTTAPITVSADVLFTQYKQQNYLERDHHQWKTPLAVRPVFLKSPRRVEALVCLLHIALQTQQLLERLYRQSMPADAPFRERRCTVDTLMRAFKPSAVWIDTTVLGPVVYVPRTTARQRHILHTLGLPTPAQTWAHALPRIPTG
jgi:transposase